MRLKCKRCGDPFFGNNEDYCPGCIIMLSSYQPEVKALAAAESKIQMQAEQIKALKLQIVM